MTVPSPSAPIAIVGIAAQLPSGNSAPSNLGHKQFFEFLLNKGEAYEKIPLERFNIHSYKGKDAGRVSAEYGTFLKHTDQLDHVELGITSKDARAMSLSTRKLIELSFLALLDSGIDYRGRNVGCFASGIVFDILSLSEPDEFEARGSFGGAPAMIANRISYYLDLLGPSIPVDTACSSSLTATHLAVQAIRTGDCDTAVVGGIQLNHRFVDWVQYSQGGILSPDGKCKPFDSSANGFSRGEAGVAIVLKRLDKAIEDGDHIYATILGTGINSAGSAAPVNAPVPAAQRDAMRRAWAQTDRKPQDVDFVEVHATGTAAGDPAEANWVGEVFQRDGELLIGSVKGNIGHTEITAFLASLTKCIHIFQTGIIPPNVNLSTPNPRIKWSEYRLHAPTECTPLPCHSGNGPLISLCSSGIGGSNGHVVLEAPPRPLIGKESTSASKRPTLLVAAALSPRSTSSVSDTLSELVIDSVGRSDFLSTVYGRRSRQMPWRSYAIYSPGQTTKLRFSSPSLVPRVKPPIVFVFAGQGPQHLDMGREMFQMYPAFRESILQMDLAYAKVVGKSLISSTGLFRGDTPSGYDIDLKDVWPIEITLPALAMIQCALVDLYASVGILPDVVIGHSAGETAVLYASGAGTKEMAVELAIARGKAMAVVESAGGTMAAVSCGVIEAEALINEALEPSLSALVDIGCHNSQDAITISGMASSIEKVINLAESRGIMARELRTRVPVHSSMMDICRDVFQRRVRDMWASYHTECRPQIPVYSTLTGEILGNSFTADYFWDGTRGPVLFTEAMTSLLGQHPSATFLELSPHPVLSSYLSALGATSVLSSLRRPKRNEVSPVEVAAFLESLGRLTTIGHNNVNFSALNDHPILDTEFSLPAYPFTPKPVPYHSETHSFYQRFQDRNGPLNFSGLRVNAQTHPVLAQHVIKGEPIMPAAGFIEMALEFGATELWGVEFRAMMSLSGEQPTPVEVKLNGLHWTVKTSTATTTDKLPTFNRTHAEGFLSLKPPKLDVDIMPLDVEAIIRRCKRIDLTDFYEDLKTFAEYGPFFQRVVDGYRGENEVLVLVNGDDDILDIDGYRFHPAILDCCLHFMVHKSFTLNDDRNVYYLPSKVGRLTMHPEFVKFGVPDHLYAHIIFKSWTPTTIIADFYIVAIDGTHLCTLTGVEVERHESSLPQSITRRHDVVFQPFALPERQISEKIFGQYSEPEDMRRIYKYLDHLAVESTQRTLLNNPISGTELNRKRYADFSNMVTVSFIPAGEFTASDISAIRRKFPEMIEITDRVAGAQERIFSTSKAAVEVLYKDDIMTRFYKHYGWAAEACADRFRAVVATQINSGKRVIRVLEVGAGTGGLTRHLAKAMEEFPDIIIEFTISDVSKELLPRMTIPYCRYKSFDLSQSSVSQGFELASFDIITGFHVLHVVEDIVPSLVALSELLVPGGSLVIGDLKGDSWTSREPGTIWFDYVFGSFAEWFSFTDARSHCTMSTNVWKQHLHTAGFGQVYTEDFVSDPLLFTLEAQKCPIPCFDAMAELDDRKIIFHYQRGNEGLLRKQLVAQDTPSLSLWLFSSSGFNGDAGMGFSRSLGREYPLWDIHFVVFERTRSEDDMTRYVSQLSSIQGLEMVIVINSNDEILVPRVIPSTPHSGKSAFHSTSPWLLADTEVIQSSPPLSNTEFVTVKIIAISHLEGKIRGFVGRVSSASSPLAHQLVVGLAIAPNISSVLSIHHAILSKLPDELENIAGDIAEAVVGFVMVAIGGDVSKLCSKRRHRSGKVLLTQGSGTVVPSIKWLLQLLGFEVIEVKSNSPSHLALLSSTCDLILSGVEDPVEKQVLSHCNSRVFMWNDPQTGLAAVLEKDPFHIGDALDFIVGRVGVQWPQGSTSTWIADVPLPDIGTLVPSLKSLFDSSKAYLLIGGLGGVGIRVALWMYQKGARYLVLTSRSGKASLARVQDRMALRILAYLESCPDLCIRLVASDATSEDSTCNLLRSIPPDVALGGCMLLTAVLSDRTFAFSDDKDFEKVFASKTGACGVLDRCIPGGIPALDFFIPFSSVVGLFGNGGQTNYASANTALDGMVRQWDNSFTFILPAVIDGGGLASETREQGGRLGHLTPWGVSSQHICDCLEDGIRKLSDGPFWQYIPGLDWSLVQKYLGSSRLFAHLVNNTSDESGTAEPGETGKSITEVIIDLLDVDSDEFDGDVPFTAYGLDSLSAARLSFELRPFVAVSQLQLLSDISLNDLQAKIERAQTPEREKDTAKVATEPSIPEPSPVEIHVSKLEAIIEKHTRTLPTYIPVNSSKPIFDGEIILITGTTGAIGTSMLAQLASMESISRIYAFNRGDPDKLYDRQSASLQERGYDERILEQGKIVLIAGDHSKHDLGISPRIYEEIRGSVTAIIHNAWPVSFTASLASLEPSIRSVRVFVDLVLASSRPEPPRLLFLSSIGLFNNRTGTDAAPEEPIFDGKRIVGTGYAESKWIAERILQKAAEKTPLRPIIVRAGQICGGSNGAWNTTEWFPALVKSATYLGSLPEADGNISWIPLHTAAKALIEMRHADRQVLHLSHPRPIPWSTIANFLSDTFQIPLRPYEEWLRTLEASVSAPAHRTEDSNPALRLLYYFKALEVGTNSAKEALGLPKLSVVEGLKASSALRDVDQLTAMDAAHWVNNWEKGGFLKQ